MILLTGGVMLPITRYDAFRHVHYLLAADEHGSFRRAAGALSVKPSAISRRVRDMEDRLGVSLFTRSTSGLQLTVAGKHFLWEVRRVLGQLDDAVRDAGAYGRAEAGDVKIGLPFAPGDIWSSMIKGCREGNAIEGRIMLVEAAARDILAALRRHDIDLAFVPGDQGPRDCRVQPLWREGISVVLPERHRLSLSREIHLADLAGERCLFSDGPARSLLDQQVLARLFEGDMGPLIEYRPLQRENLLHIVALGHGIVATTEGQVRGLPAGVVWRPVLAGKVVFSMLWLDRNDNPLARRLIAALRERANL